MEAVKRWRAGWGYPTSLLCVYGFFSTVKPLEPFLIPYLTGPDKNLTMEQVANQILPVWTYSYLAVLVPVFLVTDWLLYKPVVVFQCTALFVTTAMLLWLNGVLVMQAMQFFYGVVTACEVAYFSYIYSMVEPKHYRKATSYCRAVQLMGYTVGSVLGQLLVSFSLLSYHYLLVFTLVLTASALVTACLLPMPRRSMFFHQSIVGNEDDDADQSEAKVRTDPSKPQGAAERREAGTGGAAEPLPQRDKLIESNPDRYAKGKDEEQDSWPSPEAQVDCSNLNPDREAARRDSGGSVTEGSPRARVGCGAAVRMLWQDVLLCYASRELLYWSVWWALATCGYNQTVNYVQALWEEVEPSSNFTIYNGGVEAVSTLFGAATAYGIGFTRVDWAQWGELALGGFSGLSSGALFLTVFTGNIWACYAGYVVFKCLYMLLITIAMFQIAAGLSVKRYALIFGVNTFCALVLQTIFTSIVVDSRGLGLGIVTQFIVYGGYFAVIALVFLLRGSYTVLRARGGRGRSKAAPPSVCSQGQSTDQLCT